MTMICKTRRKSLMWLLGNHQEWFESQNRRGPLQQMQGIALFVKTVREAEQQRQ